MAELLVATTNRGKLEEIREALEPLGLRLLSLEQVEPVAEPEETEPTFEGNALLKARYYCRHAGVLTLADDSGLEIDAWGGAPGIHSARWPTPGMPYPQRHRLVLQRLAEEPNRKARFVCSIALAAPEGRELLVRGTVEGRIAAEPRGTGGFGYDPIFELPELGLTFGEMPAERKAKLSHRGRALQALREQLPAWLRDQEA